MRPPLSTTQHLHLDLDTRVMNALQNGAPECYGVTWKRGLDGLVPSYSGISHATPQMLEDYVPSDQGWLSSGGRTASFLSAPHQIHWTTDAAGVQPVGAD